MKRRETITFLSDYGLQDEFVGVCHGVMLMLAPHVRIVDIHHNISPHDVRQGAVVLEQTVGYMPESVHLAVVDPKVGSARRAIAVETYGGHFFVGPDNGLLAPAIAVTGGASRAISISDERFMLTPISKTFHGRDIFGPAAAHIASGVEIAELGENLPVDDLVELDIPHAWIHDDHLHAEVLQLDRFGNLQLNLAAPQLEEAGMKQGDLLELRLEGHRLNVPYGGTFDDVEPGHFIVVVDSYRHMSLAINRGNAGAKLRAHTGSTVIVGPARR